MDVSHSRNIKIVAILLLLAAISQPIYTALSIALVMAKRYALGFSAIAFSAVLNVVQVGVGLTQFGPFGGAVAENPELGALAGGVVAFSFFCYNAAKILLGLAAIVFGMGKMSDGSKLLGGLTALVGTVAFFANTIVMMFGRDGFLPSPVAGGSGVAATLLLAICIFSLKRND